MSKDETSAKERLKKRWNELKEWVEAERRARAEKDATEERRKKAMEDDIIEIRNEVIRIRKILEGWKNG